MPSPFNGTALAFAANLMVYLNRSHVSETTGIVSELEVKIVKKLRSAIAGTSLIFLGISNIVGAVSLTESVDVGEFLFNAGQTNIEPSGTVLTSIVGNLTDSGGGAADIDLYQIFVPGGTFSASTVGNTNILDTQLFLFNSAGFGLAASNDTVNDPFFKSTISLSSVPTGIYYIGISFVGSDPESSGGAIFNIPPTGQTTANGPGAAAALSSWSTNPIAEFGSYNIAVSGAQFVGSTAIAAVPFDFNPMAGVVILGTWGSLISGWEYLKKRKNNR
jgi:hypothetical protein